MPEASDGQSTEGRVSDAGSSQRRSNPRRQQQQRGNSVRESNKFTGKCDDLKGTVYDVSEGKDTFARTTREIAEYVGRVYDDAGEFRTGMVELLLPDIEEPATPGAAATAVDVELWKLDLREYRTRVDKRHKNSDKVYALVLGQCSQALRSRMEAHPTWDTIDGGSQVIELLQLIRACITQRQTRKYEFHTLVDVEQKVHHLRQNRCTNAEYYERFKDAVSAAERLGCEIGVHGARVDRELAIIATDPDMPTDAEREQAKRTVRERYLATLFLRKQVESLRQT